MKLQLPHVLLDTDLGDVRGPTSTQRLTPTELKVFRALQARGGQPVSRESLFTEVWAGRARSERVVDTVVVEHFLGAMLMAYATHWRRGHPSWESLPEWMVSQFLDGALAR